MNILSSTTFVPYKVGNGLEHLSLHSSAEKMYQRCLEARALVDGAAIFTEVVKQLQERLSTYYTKELELAPLSTEEGWIKKILQLGYNCRALSDHKLILTSEEDIHKEIWVNKALLGFHSHYFSSLFESEWKEKHQEFSKLSCHSPFLGGERSELLNSYDRLLRFFYGCSWDLAKENQMMTLIYALQFLNLKYSYLPVLKMISEKCEINEQNFPLLQEILPPHDWGSVYQPFLFGKIKQFIFMFTEEARKWTDIPKDISSAENLLRKRVPLLVFVRDYGKYVKVLEIKIPRELPGPVVEILLEILVRYCPAIEEFRCVEGNFSLPYLKKLKMCTGLKNVQFAPKDLLEPPVIEEMTCFQDLTSLTLNGFKGKESIPNLVDKLAKLAYLSIFNGRLEAKELSHVSSLKILKCIGTCVSFQNLQREGWDSLKELDLSGSVVTALPLSIRNLESLKLKGSLKIGGDDLRNINELSALKSLNVSGCEQISAKLLGKISLSIESLNLKGCSLRMEEIPQVLPLTNLRELKLSGHGVKDGLMKILVQNKVTHLTKLYFEGSLYLTNDTLHEVGKCSQMQKLSLRNLREIDFLGIQKLTTLKRLTYLELKDCANINDRALTALAKLSSLESVLLNELPLVTDKGFKCLEYLPLRSFQLTRIDHLENDTLRSLRFAHTVTCLHLWNAFKVSQEGFNYLAVMTRLRDFQLTFNKSFSHREVKMISSLTQLRKLDITFCKEINDGAVEHFTAFPLLKTLVLKGCPITDKSWKILASLPNLESFQGTPTEELTMNGQQSFHLLRAASGYIFTDVAL